MKFKPIVYILLLALALSIALQPVYSSSKSVPSSVMESVRAFASSLESGNYSLVENRLSFLMKLAFTKESFNKLLSMLSVYGVFEKWSLGKVRVEDGIVNAVVVVEYSKARVYFTVTMDSRSGLIEGIHITAVKPPLKFSLSFAIMLCIGGLIGFLLVYMAYGFRFFSLKWLLAGASLVVIVFLAQPYMQKIPLEYIAKKVVLGGKQFIIISSIWYGFVAGFFQEILKYVLTVKPATRNSLYVGAGFGVGEAFALAFLAVYKTAPAPLTISILVLGLMERALAASFHTTTTVAYKKYHALKAGVRVLILIALAHTAIDSIAVYYNLTRSTAALVVTYILTLAFTIAILAKTRNRNTIQLINHTI